MKQSYSLSVVVRLLAIGLSSIGTLFLLPLILNTLGEYQFGIWGLVSSITGYLLLLDFGIALACTRYLSLHSENKKQWPDIISNSLVLAISISLVLLTALVLIWVFIDIASLSKDDKTIFYIISIVVIEVALSIPLRIYTSVLRTEVRYFDIGIYEITRVVLRIAGVSTALLLGYGLIEAVLIATCANLLFFTLPVVNILLRHKNLFFKPKSINISQIFELLNFSKFTAISQSADFLKFRADSLLIAAFISINTSAHYTIIVFIILMLTQILTRFMSYWDTIIIDNIGRLRYKEAHQTVIKSLKIGFYITIISIIGIALFGKIFISLWVGSDYEFLNNSLLLLSLVLFSICMQMATTPYFNALKKEKLNAYIDSGELLIKLILIYPFSYFFQLEGVILATLFATLLFGMPLRYFYLRKLTQKNLPCNSVNLHTSKCLS